MAEVCVQVIALYSSVLCLHGAVVYVICRITDCPVIAQTPVRAKTRIAFSSSLSAASWRAKWLICSVSDGVFPSVRRRCCLRAWRLLAGVYDTLFSEEELMLKNKIQAALTTMLRYFLQRLASLLTGKEGTHAVEDKCCDVGSGLVPLIRGVCVILGRCEDSEALICFLLFRR